MEVLVFLRKRNGTEKNISNTKRSGNYQHLNESDILDNGNGNANKVII